MIYDVSTFDVGTEFIDSATGIMFKIGHDNAQKILIYTQNGYTYIAPAASNTLMNVESFIYDAEIAPIPAIEEEKYVQISFDDLDKEKQYVS